MTVIFNFLVFVTFFISVKTEYAINCVDPSPTPFSIEGEQEFVAAENYYLYASNIECNNCCVKRSFHQITPDSLEITESARKGEEKYAKTFKYIVRNYNNSAIYIPEHKEKTIIIVDSDSKSYAVLYNVENNILEVYTRVINPKPFDLNSLEGVKKCNLKLYKSNPTENCQPI